MHKIVKVLKKVAKNPAVLYYYANILGLFRHISDERCIKLLWKARTGQKIDLENPTGFNEKLQWLKLHDRKPIYTIMADKVLAKDFVAEKIGKEYIIPTLAVWDDAEKIDFDALPNQFVLKCNHNSGGGMCVCKDKTQIDRQKVKEHLKFGLQQDYYLFSREWPYKNIQRKVLAEQYMEDTEKGCLIDYKFYCFEGKPRFLYVANANIRDNVKYATILFYDLDWNITEFQRNDHGRLADNIEKPVNFDKMIEFSEVLSQGTHFLRVDWYEINGKLYFGEMTFSPEGGFGIFAPAEWENKFGEYIKLPTK